MVVVGVTRTSNTACLFTSFSNAFEEITRKNSVVLPETQDMISHSARVHSHLPFIRCELFRKILAICCTTLSESAHTCDFVIFLCGLKSLIMGCEPIFHDCVD